jgi:hypothetical protein
MWKQQRNAENRHQHQRRNAPVLIRGHNPTTAHGGEGSKQRKVQRHAEQ